MILIYVDDILVVFKDTINAMHYLSNIDLLKKVIMGPTNRYLGANIEKVQTENVSARYRLVGPIITFFKRSMFDK